MKILLHEFFKQTKLLNVETFLLKNAQYDLTNEKLGLGLKPYACTPRKKYSTYIF